MPGLARKLLIYATTEGLLLRQTVTKYPNKNDVHIAYGTYEITLVPQDEEDKNTSSTPIEAHGLVGLLNLVSTSYLIAITQSEQVAQIRGKAIYAVRDVALIPLSSKAEAEKAIKKAPKSAKPDKDSKADTKAEETDLSDVEDDVETTSVAADEQTHDADSPVPSKEGSNEQPKDAKNSGQGKGRYGRFATRWFSKSGSNANAQRKQGQSGEDALPPAQQEQDSNSVPASDDNTPKVKNVPEPEEDLDKRKDTKPDDDADADADADGKASKDKSAVETLVPRILKNARLFFSWSGFFFSYEHDLSGTLMQKGNLVSDLPMWKRFDPIYFWNHHLVKPFIDAGCNEFVMPLMQGFVGQRSFSITETAGEETDVVAGASQDPAEVIAAASATSDPKATDTTIGQTHDFLLTLISRRSVKRAGLRYTRRGVDDEGSVANSVETEQILSTKTWDDVDKAFSLLQTRGSIPLHFSQSPWNIKPTPIIYGSESTNQAALRKHFTSMVQRYRQVQVVSLVSTHIPEAPIGEAFEKHVEQLNEGGGVDGKNIGFEWFDFHTACKGMRFENVAILIDSLESTLKSFGWIVKQHDRNTGQQNGVLRTNCMDCLDRSNVVQSYIAGWALEQQLSELGLKVDLKKDPTTQWFNTLWADNGDMISKQYAGSSALKGDFTRNRKRNWTGALSDFSLTMTRYYNNVLGDYFAQTCIDYYLGNAGPAIFDEFETDMMSKDYALDMKRIRQNAIDTCERIVLEDPNDGLLAGWTLSCPKDSNTLRSLPFEECVILLTNTAFYFCRFDWNTEKVGSFERVDLRDISEIWRGTYITSGLGQTNLDESKNVGFALKYKPSKKSIIRRNTRSLLTEEDEATDEAKDQAEQEEHKDSDKKDTSGKEKQSNADSEGKKNNAKQKDSNEDETRVLAFKALPPESSAAKYESENVFTRSEADMMKHICDKVRKAVEANARKRRVSAASETEKIPQVEERDVISVADAKKSTGYMEAIGYSMKRLVWS